ncbi:hypothetical protein EI94DRAFT_1724000 [Lactarius quietus]|nr:hypothetical protein EI94DRAFT_1724000 [Lactarius quietus]
MYVRTHTTATLTIRRSLSNICVAEILIKFKPDEFGDDRAVGLEDSNHRVSLNFVCGMSQSLADVTRVLGSQARTALPLRVPRFLKLPQLAALLPPTSERVYNVPHHTIDWLNDDILLEIFNCYRLNNEFLWTYRREWLKLSQVCQRWRHLIYDFAFHLGMQIHCTPGARTVDTLDHLPSMPLHVEYRYGGRMTKRTELGLYHALRLRDRLFKISLHLPPSILHKCFALMDKTFPILAHLKLSVSSTSNVITTFTLPKAFLAPNLRYLELPDISPPRRLRVLTSTVSLVTLVLTVIQTTSYLRPRLLVARLSSLPQLEGFSIYISLPITHPSADRELFGEKRTPVTLPRLKTFWFHGASAYLESLVAQIRAPILERLEITLFNQNAFALPHLSHLISITEALKPFQARVCFGHHEVTLTMTHDSRLHDEPFSLSVRCEQYDSQINCAAQVCALIPTLSRVERLVLDLSHWIIRIWGNGEIDDATWHELLRPFIGVRQLELHEGLVIELARALQLNEVGSDPGFLPDLQKIYPGDHLFTPFFDTRQVVDLPDRLS